MAEKLDRVQAICLSAAALARRSNVWILALARNLVLAASATFICATAYPNVILAEPASPSTSSALTIVIDQQFSPYALRAPDGKPDGYLIELWQLWSAQTGIPVHIKLADGTTAQKLMIAGEADVIDGIFRTNALGELYEFSDPYVAAPLRVYTDEGLGPISDLTTLIGTTIGVRGESACATHLAKKGVTTIRYESAPALVAAALRGAVKAFCLDEASAKYHLESARVARAFKNSFELDLGFLHYAVLRGNGALRERIAEGMTQIDLAKVEALREKWMGHAHSWAPIVRLAGFVALTTLTFALLLAIWIYFLRRTVRTKTAELEREKASLNASEERFRRLFEDSCQATVLLEEGVFVAANNAALALLGMSRLDQLVGKGPLDISPRTLRDGRQCADELPKIAERAEKEDSIEFEWVHVRADGQLIDLSILLTPIRIDQRNLLHVVWTDIGPQKAAEAEGAALRNELERRVGERTSALAQMTSSLRNAIREQQAIFDATTVGVVFVVERTIMRCNRATEALFGRDASTLVGQTTRVFYRDEETYQMIGQHIADQLAECGRFREEADLVRSDGSIFRARLSTQYLAADDPAAGVVTIIEDMTQEAEAFKALHEAKVIAEEAARVKSDFVANMSHEIRTPMTGILGMTHLLLQQDLSPKQREYLEKIKAAGRHLLGVINDILDFSKIEAGKMIIEHVDFNLKELTDGVASIVGESARVKGLEFAVDIAPDVPPYLVGDPMRLAQILNNFAANAVKFTDEGRVGLNVEVQAQEENGVTLRFSVRDSGCGIDPNLQANLFTSFQQADSSITRSHGGTGLGLAISKQLVENMHGTIGVDSTPGIGSVFWFNIPLGIGTEEGATHKTNPAAQLPTPEGLSHLQLLLVEDNPLNQEVALAMLAHFGINVDLATNGATAVQMVQHKRYDLVLMDVQMPVMDGLAATRAIRKLPGHNTLPIVAMTANAMVSDRDACIAAGMNDHLGKPIDVDRLLAKIVKWTNAKGTLTLPEQAQAPAPDQNADACLLDTHDGLRRCMDRTPMYQRTLKSFIRHFTQSPDKMRDAIATCDLETLSRTAHSLKGAAGQIGALALAALARELEAAAKAQAPFDTLSVQCDALAGKMDDTLAAIHSYLTALDCAASQAASLSVGGNDTAP